MARTIARRKRMRTSAEPMEVIGFRLDAANVALLEKAAAFAQVSKPGFARTALIDRLNNTDLKQFQAEVAAFDQKLTNASDILQREVKGLRRAVGELARVVTRFMGAVERVDS